jgi:tetratricopeptide (TPR) repeat protein
MTDNDQDDDQASDQQRAALALKRGWVAVELQRYSAAEREARAALALTPNSAYARLLLIEVLYRQSRFEELNPVLEEALALAPDWHEVQHAACVVWCAQTELDRAIEAADAYARLAPDTAAAHALRAEIALRSGDARSAIAHAERALAIDPSLPEPRDVIARATLDDDPRRTEAVLLERLADDPTNVHALINLGVALDRQGRAWDAAQVFKNAVRLDPSNELARANTRAAVESWATPAAGVGAAVLLSAKGIVATGAVVVANDSKLGAALAVLVMLAVLAALVGPRIRRSYHLRRLAREDPALYAMFRNIERDEQRVQR